MGNIESFLEQHDYKGRMLGGIYRLESVLGHGGFGEVWRGTDTRDGKLVAIKLLPVAVEKANKSLKQLEHECRMLINLSHPNICRMLDFIYDDDIGVALVTELIDGTDIYNASTPETVGCYIIQLLQALAYLHGKNVYHFDIKPGNVLVSNGTVKLIDFGLSSLFPERKKAGTPSYMAPEIVADEGKKDARTELYAVGVLWLVCLTRLNPFRSPSLKEANEKHLNWKPHPALERILDGKAIIQLLKVKPEERFQTATELLKILQLTVNGGISLSDEIAAAYGRAGGNFIGRHEIIDRALEWSRSPNTGQIMWMVVSGEHGCGKSRLLNQCKLRVQAEHCRTIDIRSADQITLESIKPLADSLAEARPPLLIVLDDYDKWINTFASEPLRQLLNVLHHHPHPPTNVFCLASCADTYQLPPYFSHMQLHPFTVDEVAQFIDAVARVPPAKRQDLASRMQQHTGGNPMLLTKVVSALTKQGMLISEAGSWDEHLFEDISIDIPEYSIAPESIIQESPDEILELSQEDRKTGHPLRALDRLLHYPHMTEALLLEAVECAIPTGKANEVITHIQKYIDSMPDKGRLLYHCGILHMVRNDHKTAKRVLQEALGQVGGDLALSLSIRNQLARCDLLHGEFQKAIVQFRETRWEESNLENGVVILNNELGYALLLYGHCDEAGIVLEEDIQKYRRVGHVRRLLQTLMWHAETQIAMGERSWDKAEQDYQQVINMARDHQELKLLGEAYNALAGIMLQGGKLKEGTELYRKALSLHFVLHQLPGVAVIMNNLGLCFLAEGHVQEAQFRFESAMEFLRDASGVWRGNLVQSFLGMAEIYRTEKNYGDANTMLDQAEKIANSADEWGKNAYSILMTRAQVRQAEGDPGKARDLAVEAKPYAKMSAQQKEWEGFMKSLM